VERVVPVLLLAPLLAPLLVVVVVVVVRVVVVVVVLVVVGDDCTHQELKGRLRVEPRPST